MTPDAYRRLDGLAIADLVRRREVSPREVAAAAIAVIEAENPRVNAVIRRMDDSAERDLAALDPAAPLAGVPFLLKDIGAQAAGVPTMAGNRWLARVLPPAQRDDELVARFRRAGLATLGKTSTPDLGMNVTTEPVLTGITRNPFDPTRSSGGSSGGAAAAVASGMVPIAHATDGAGSIRIPAACCGLVGLKASRGAIPEGPEASHIYQGLVCGFVVSRTVRDSAAALDAVWGEDPGAPYAAPHAGRFLDAIGRPPSRLRIAVDATVPDDVTVDPAAIEAMRHVARRLDALGHEVEDAALPLSQDDLRVPVRAYATQAKVQTAVMLDEVQAMTGEAPRREEFEPVLWAAAEQGRRMPAIEMARTEHAMHALARKLAPFFQRWDVLLTPAVTGPAWPLGSLPTDHDDVDLHARRMLSFAPFTAMWNVTGQPALVLPSGRFAGALPLGVQLVSRLGRDGMLLALGEALMAAT